MKSSMRSGKPAFTLVEVMAVVTITLILATLVVSGVGFIKERQAKEKANIQIALLSKAIEDYKVDMGAYPGIAADTPEAGEISEELYMALFKDGYDYTSETTPPTTWTKATKIYLSTLDPTSTKQGWFATKTLGDDLKILDPWGNEYRYRKGSNAMNPDFDLWSAGKDGLTRTGITASDISHKDVRDDIKNF